MRMIRLVLAFVIFCSFQPIVFAQNGTLKIATAIFIPPNVMMIDDKKVYGFDISLMQFVCKELQVQCKFIPMPFDQVISTVEKGEADLGVGSIIITPSRAAQVNFSDPYLPSNVVLLTNKSTIAKHGQALNLQNLQFGVLDSSVYEQLLEELNIPEQNISIYNEFSDILNALHQGDIDITISDGLMAQFWSVQNPNFVRYGQARQVGYGVGVAVNKNRLILLKGVNQAIDKYLKSPNFTKQYEMYMTSFETSTDSNTRVRSSNF